MVQSMTGYGKATCEYAGKTIVVELKSLNSKQLDLSMRLAGIYREKEMEIRTLLASRIERGKVECSIYMDNKTQNGGQPINLIAIENYYTQIQAIATKLQIPLPADWFSTLLHMPDVMKSADVVTLEEEEWVAVQQVIHDCIEHFQTFRLKEGESLRVMFQSKLNNITQLLTEIEQYEGERIAKVKERLEEALTQLSQKAKIDVDTNRLEQEFIYYIEKLDINEEKVRLRNHLAYFEETMQNEKGAGKKLGFITQEIGREVNTLGSKANHSEMQKCVVQMKDELEQIKEQVLNVL